MSNAVYAFATCRADGADPRILVVAGRENRRTAEVWAARAIDGTTGRRYMAVNYDGDAALARADVVAQMADVGV